MGDWLRETLANWAITAQIIFANPKLFIPIGKSHRLIGFLVLIRAACAGVERVVRRQGGAKVLHSTPHPYRPPRITAPPTDH